MHYFKTFWNVNFWVLLFFIHLGSRNHIYFVCVLQYKKNIFSLVCSIDTFSKDLKLIFPQKKWGPIIFTTQLTINIITTSLFNRSYPVYQREVYDESSFSIKIMFYFEISSNKSKDASTLHCPRMKRKSERPILLENCKISTMRKRKTNMDRCSSILLIRDVKFGSESNNYTFGPLILTANLKLFKGDLVLPNHRRSFLEFRNPPFDLQHDHEPQE